MLSCSLRWVVLSLLLFSLHSLAYEKPSPRPRWVVVTAPVFHSAVAPLCDLRKTQGFDVVVISTTDVLTPQEILGGKAEKLRARVNQVCREAKGENNHA